jgi:hypothetical protein
MIQGTGNLAMPAAGALVVINDDLWHISVSQFKD